MVLPILNIFVLLLLLCAIYCMVHKMEKRLSRLFRFLMHEYMRMPLKVTKNYLLHISVWSAYHHLILIYFGFGTSQTTNSWRTAKLKVLILCWLLMCRPVCWQKI